MGIKHYITRNITSLSLLTASYGTVSKLADLDALVEDNWKSSYPKNKQESSCVKMKWSYPSGSNKKRKSRRENKTVINSAANTVVNLAQSHLEYPAGLT